MALNILPITEEEKVFIDIIIETMIKGMQQIQSSNQVTGTFKELLIILGMTESEYLPSIKYRIIEAKEILDNKVEHIIIMDKFDRRLFIHTVVNAYNTPEVYMALSLSYEEPMRIMRSVWAKADEIINFWDKIEGNSLASIFQKAFGLKSKRRTRRYGNE